MIIAEVILLDDDIIKASQDKHNAELKISDFDLAPIIKHTADRIVFRPQIGGPDIIFKDRRNPESVRH